MKLMALDKEIIKNKLRKFICRDLMKRPDYPLRDDHSLINGGFLDSFAVVDLLMFIEDNFDVFIPNEEMDVERMDTLDKLTDYVLEWKNGSDA